MHRKAQAEQLFPAIIYLLLLAAVVMMIVIIPSTILENAAETHERDNAIFNERIYAKLSTRDPLTNRVVPGVLTNNKGFTNKAIEKAFDTGNSPRRIGFKLTYDHRSVYYDEKFYRDAKPLSPVRYPGFVQYRPLILEDELKQLEIDQVYSRKLEDWS